MKNIGRSYTTETLKAAIAKSTLEKANIRTILSENGLQGELLETTADELANAASTNAVAASQAGATGTTLGLGTAFTGLRIAVKKATTAMIKFLFTTPAGWATLAVGAFATAAVAVVNYNKQLEENKKKTREAAKEAKSAIDSIKSDFETLSSDTDKVKRRYAELAQQVENLGKTNQSRGELTAEDYEEFLGLSNQLSKLFPQLTKGYDDNGNAILNLSGNVDTIVSSIENLISVQQKLANQEILEKMPRVWAGYMLNIEDYEKNLSDMEEKSRATIEAISRIGSEKTLSISLQSMDGFEGELNRVISEAIDRLGYDRSKMQKLITHTVGSGRAMRITGHEIDWDFSSLNESQFEQFKNELGVLSQEYEDAVMLAKNKIDSANTNMASYINTWLTGEWNYNKLDPNIQYVAKSLLFDGDWIGLIPDSVDSTKWDEVSNWIQQEFLFRLQKVQDNEEISKALSEVFSNVELTPEAKASYIKQIQDYFGEKSMVTILLQPQLEATEDLQKQYDDAVSRFGENEKNILVTFFKEHSINDTSEIDYWNKVTESAESAEEAVRLYSEAQHNSGEKPLSFDISTHKDQIDNFQSKVKSLGDALSSIRSGNFEDSDLADLLKEFPELTDRSDDLETALVKLINNSLKTLYKALGENIPDGLKVSFQEFTDLASGAAVHLSDAFSSIHDSWDIMQDFKDTMASGFDDNITDSLLQSVRKLSGKLETLVAGYYSGVVTAEQLYEALTEHYENDLHNYSEALIKKNELNAEFYNAVGLASKEVTNQFMDCYGVDIEHCKTYNQAKIKIEEQTLKKINGVWSKYYDAESKTLTTDAKVLEIKAANGDAEAGRLLDEIKTKVYYYESAVDALNNITYEGVKSNFESIGSKLGENSSSSEKDFEETFDWIETAINRVERSISNLNLKASSVYRSWSERNSNLKAELSDVKKEMDIQASGYSRYMQKAASVGLSEEWASKVRNGQIDINSITDKALAERIKEYQDWYEKALKCQDAVEDLRESVSKLYETAFDNIVSQFDSIVSVIENSKSMLDKQINQAEERGYIANVAYYEALIKVEQKNMEQLTKERASLQSALADAVSNGAIKEGSQEWADMSKQIHDVTLSIEEANTAMIQYGNSIRDIQWQIFDLIQDRISRISSESDFLINLLSNDKQYDDRGQLTDTGMSTVGLHGMNYNVYMAQADKYAQEMLRIDKELAEDPYNNDLYNRRAELLELQQESIIAAENEKQAIIDMVEEGIELEISAIEKLVDQFEEALDAEKDLYDYQKNLSKQTEEIASLQKQLSAYEGDMSEEARQKVQQIKLSLENAQSQLEESEFDHYLSEQKKLLDSLVDEYSDALNQRLDNIDALIADMLASSNANADMISNTLSSKADSVGYYLSESMEDIWNTNTGSMLDALAMYDSNIMGGFAEVNTSVGEVIRGITETVSGIGNVNTTITSAISSVTGNMQAILDKLYSVSTMQSSGAASSYYGGNGNTSSSSSSGTGFSNIGNGSSGTSGSGGNGFFLYSKDSYPKNKLNKDTSIIDRLRYFDFDYSFSARSSYYSKMGLPGTYTGTAAQNVQMLNWMKLNGYKNGVYNLKKDEWAWTQEGGKPEVVLNPDGSITRPDGSVLTPLSQGANVLNADATKNLYSFMNNPQAFVRSIGSGNIPTPTQKTTDINMGGVEFIINAPNATNWEEIKQDAMKDRQFTKFVQTITVGEAAGGSSLKKYNI